MTADFDGPFPVSFDEVVQTAVGLGGWKVDPADPFKAPYTPPNAAHAALSFHDWPKDDPEYDKLFQILTELVQEEYDDDPTTREEKDAMCAAWSERKMRERGVAA